MYSSQSEADVTDASAKRKTRKSKTDAIPQLVDALSLCYIGSLLLRLPITVNDIYTWVASGELLYYRAVRALPQSMRQRLPFNYTQTLDPQTTLKPSTLHKAVWENISAYHQSFGMLTPPINHVLVLYRWIRGLALPLEIYTAVLRLAKMLDIGFAYDTDAHKRMPQLRVIRLPEARLIGLLVVATKLLFPLDEVKRYPRKPTELSVLAMDWSVWSAAKDSYDISIKRSEPLGYEDALRVSETDVLDMSNDKLDQYMDWYAASLGSEDLREKGRAGKEAEFRRVMFRYFPVDRPGRQHEESWPDSDNQQSHLEGERIKTVQRALRPLRLQEDGGSDDNGEIPLRPGSHYKRYKVASDLAGHAEHFYEEAAKVSGLSLESLVQCAFHLERRLQEWEENARKESVRGGGNTM